MNKWRVLILFLLLLITSVVHPFTEEVSRQQEIQRNHIISMQIAELLYDLTAEGGYDEYALQAAANQLAKELATTEDCADTTTPPELVVRWEQSVDSLVTPEMFSDSLETFLLNFVTSDASDETLAVLSHVLVRMNYIGAYTNQGLVQKLVDEVTSRTTNASLPSLHLADAFLNVWNYLEHYYSEKAYGFGRLFPDIRNSLYAASHFHEIDLPEEIELPNFSFAYVGALFQKASQITSEALSNAERSIFSMVADLHIQAVLDEADFSMRVPVWVSPFNSIHLDRHMEHLYGFSLYKRYGGRLELPQSQMASSITLFEDMRAGGGNRFFASGLWALPARYEDMANRDRASFKDIVKIITVGRNFISHRLLVETTETLLLDYKDASGKLLDFPDMSAVSSQEELTAWLLYAYITFLTP